MNNKNVTSEWPKMGSSFAPTLHGLDHDVTKIIASIFSVQYEAFIAIYRFSIEADWALFLNKYIQEFRLLYLLFK